MNNSCVKHNEENESMFVVKTHLNWLMYGIPD